jgi:hypothetical protein
LYLVPLVLVRDARSAFGVFAPPILVPNDIWLGVNPHMLAVVAVFDPDLGSLQTTRPKSVHPRMQEQYEAVHWAKTG